MNNSGLAVVYASQKHHLKSEDMIVVHDDIDLPLGKIRISQNSSAGGHRGVQSVINHLKSKNFIHLKIGVGPIKRWPNFQAAKYVLQKFNNSEKKLLADSLQKAHKALLAIITDGPKKAMNQYN
jgi:PTH1 family peptidyl-tRNA hydrolase